MESMGRVSTLCLQGEDGFNGVRGHRGIQPPFGEGSDAALWMELEGGAHSGTSQTLDLVSQRIFRLLRHFRSDGSPSQHMTLHGMAWLGTAWSQYRMRCLVSTDTTKHVRSLGKISCAAARCGMLLPAHVGTYASVGN